MSFGILCESAVLVNAHQYQHLKNKLDVMFLCLEMLVFEVRIWVTTQNDDDKVRQWSILMF